MQSSTTIPAGEFKAKCLRLMDEVQQSHKAITITKYGKAIAQLVPIESQKTDYFACMKDSIEIVGDIISPIDVE